MKIYKVDTCYNYINYLMSLDRLSAAVRKIIASNKHL